MFGIFRTLLAVAVVFDHFGGHQGFGAVAVFSFFCLSGFLMTLLMAGPYHGDPMRFFGNRFLRLYPLYWTTAALAVGLLLHVRAPVAGSVSDVVYQILYIARAGDPVRWVPTAWAVTNEMAFYLAIGLGLSKTLRRSLVWLTLSAVMVATFVIFSSSWSESYFSVLGASLPFSIGATLYHLLRRPGALRLPQAAERCLPVILILAGVALVVAMEMASRAFYGKDTTLMVHWAYAGLVPTALIVAILFQLKGPWIARWDELIGRFSYPIYLVQFAVAWFLGTYGVTNVWILLATMFVLSALLLLLVDTPVQRVRRRVRGGQDPIGAAHAASSARSHATV